MILIRIISGFAGLVYAGLVLAIAGAWLGFWLPPQPNLGLLFGVSLAALMSSISGMLE